MKFPVPTLSQTAGLRVVTSLFLAAMVAHGVRLLLPARLTVVRAMKMSESRKQFYTSMKRYDVCPYCVQYVLHIYVCFRLIVYPTI